MKKKINEFIDYVILRGKDLLELVNQYFFLIVYICLFFNFIVISIIFLKKILYIFFYFMLTLMIILQLENLINKKIILIYNTAFKKLLFLNLILLLLNILNIFLMYSDIYLITFFKLYENITQLYFWILSKL